MVAGTRRYRCTSALTPGPAAASPACELVERSGVDPAVAYMVWGLEFLKASPISLPDRGNHYPGGHSGSGEAARRKVEAAGKAAF